MQSLLVKDGRLLILAYFYLRCACHYQVAFPDLDISFPCTGSYMQENSLVMTRLRRITKSRWFCPSSCACFKGWSVAGAHVCTASVVFLQLLTSKKYLALLGVVLHVPNRGKFAVIDIA